jgi:hypothetical protein
MLGEHVSIFKVEMEAICSSEMSVDFQQTMWCHIPEDRMLHTTAVRTPDSIFNTKFSFELLSPPFIKVFFTKLRIENVVVRKCYHLIAEQVSSFW